MDQSPTLPNSAGATTPVGKKILPPNDPARPDWGILSDCLGGERIGPSADCVTPEHGAAEMKNLLRRVISSDAAYSSLVYKCGGRKIGAFLASEPCTDQQELVSFIKSRLWNRRRDGERTVSRTGAEFSTNDVLLYWNPQAGGIHKYLEQHIGFILRRDWVERTMQEGGNARSISVEDLAAKGREIDADGGVFDPTARAHSGAGDEEPDYVEHDDATLPTSTLERQAVRRSDEEVPDAEIDDTLSPDDRDALRLAEETITQLERDEAAAKKEEEAAREKNMTLAEREFMVASIGSREAGRGGLILTTENHPDYRLFAAALSARVPAHPELDVETRDTQLVDLAREVIETHYSDQPDAKLDYLDEVAEWVPHKESFAFRFPDIVEELQAEMANVGVAEHSNQSVQCEFLLSAMETAKALDNLRRGQPARPLGVPLVEWEEMHQAKVAWFEAQAGSIDDLADPERPDHLGMCYDLSLSPDTSLSGKALSKKLKRLFSEWSRGLLSDAQTMGSGLETEILSRGDVISEVVVRMNQSWDPMKDGYAGQCMLLTMAEVERERAQRMAAEREAESARVVEERARETSAQAPKIVVTMRPIPTSEQSLLFAEADFLAPPERASISPPPLAPSPEGFGSVSPSR